ncbi:MAG: SUF system Fe-S cluster assembly regulator [Pseudobdellovibrionaceae bacterium]|jgi:FeS assembly SUF system regulator|nr:SUF system Fe-S cluster assembly regulator [Pseudobdellovibrionaceae bacterium]
MIKLSKLSDYAIVVLSQLAAEHGALLTASELSAKTTIPEPTVAKVLKLLSKSDIINSSRGVRGGYNMTRAPKEITVAELIEALEGPILITSCADHQVESDCNIAEICPMHGKWARVNMVVKDALGTLVLSDLLVSVRKKSA